MIISPPTQPLPTDKAGEIIYPVDNGEPMANDTEHYDWINFLKNGLDDWFADRQDVFVAADLLWYPIKGRPDISRAPDVMVVLNHRSGPRSSYKQWEEEGRPPQVVFEFLSTSNSAGEMMEKLDFYSELGCEEFFMYDYQRGKFHAFLRHGAEQPLATVKAGADGCWQSVRLGMTFGLDEKGRLWVKRPDGKLMETQRQLAIRADVEMRRAETEARRAETEAQRADKLAARLRELGIDPEAI